MSQKRKKKWGKGVFLHWCAMHSGKIAHTHFQMLSKPQEHTERSHVCLTLIILLQKKRGGGLFRKEQTNSCPFCNSLVTSTCQTRGSHPPRYKRHQVLPTLKVARVAAGLTGTILLLWGPASNAPPTCLQLVFPGSPLHSRNRDRFLLSH